MGYLLLSLPGDYKELLMKTHRAQEIPGIKIFRSSSTIFYTNAEMYLEALQEKSGIEIGKLLTAKKKRDAKLKREHKKAEKEAKKQDGAASRPPAGLSETPAQQGGVASSPDGRVGGADPATHSLVLDVSTASFVDTVAVKTLTNIFRDFGEIDVDVYLAGCQVCVVEQLEAAGFFSSSLPKTRLFVSVHDAVLHVLQADRRTDCLVDVSCSTRM